MSGRSPDPAWTSTGLLVLSAAAEHPSEHPLARAVVDEARERGLKLAPVAKDFDSAPGVGW